MFKRILVKVKNTLQQSIILILRGYQMFLSPLLGNCCRFHPNCSLYAQDAIQHYGVTRGCWMTLKRLLRCHPWHPGGYDPIQKR